MASLALKSSASAFNGLSICSSSGLKSHPSKTACRGTKFAVVRAGESREQDEQIVSRRSLSIAAAASLALSNQPIALAARRGTGKAEETKEKKPEDDPKLSALEKRAIVKARQMEELKAKVAKEKAKASDVATPANIQSNVATPIEKAKEAAPSVEKVKEAVPSVEKVKEAVPSVEKVTEAVPSFEKVKEAVPSVEKAKEAVPSVEKVKEAVPSVEKVKEAVPSVEQAKEAVPSSFIDTLKNAVEATPLASGSGSAE
jgi:hypothetical protein